MRKKSGHKNASMTKPYYRGGLSEDNLCIWLRFLSDDFEYCEGELTSRTCSFPGPCSECPHPALPDWCPLFNIRGGPCNA